MRWLAFLLAFYVFSLAVVPCSDHVGQTEGRHLSEAQGRDNHQHEECTPFCICACCGTPVVFGCNAPFLNKITKAVQSPVFGFFIIPLLSNRNIGFWQPPKIAFSL